MDNRALQKIGYGHYVLTTCSNGKDNGCIFNTFAQLAGSPLRVGVSVSKENFSCTLLQERSEFNITVLDESARFDTFKRFGFQSGKNVDKFSGTELPRSFSITVRDAGGSKAVSLASSAILASATVGTRVNITNSVPYIMRLEHGYSRQAPQGMVRVAVDELVRSGLVYRK